MLIRSQDKRSLVNFKNVVSVYILTPEECYGITSDNEKSKNVYRIGAEYNSARAIMLGQYSTIGQAKDILDEIETFYSDKIANRLIYQMPSDDGVIWEERHGEINT